MSANFVTEVTTSSFDTEVLARSKKTLIVVDFWAAWCGPCRALAPVLEKLVGELEGAAILAKVDTDAWPELARQYGVQSLPTVKLFRDEKIVDEFVGAQPETAIRATLQKYLPTPVNPLLTEARQLAKGNPQAAIELMQRGFEYEPDNIDFAFELTELYLATGQIEPAQALLDQLPANVATTTQAEQFKSLLRLEQTAQQQAGETDENSVRLQQALQALRAGEYDAAMTGLADILRTNPNWNDGQARKTIADVFKLPQLPDQVRSNWRRKIASLLN